MEFEEFTPVVEERYFESISVHKGMLQDELRVNSFFETIADVVKDKTVLDIGTGIGILSLFAADNGAKKVYALENTRIIYIAEKIAEQNNLADKIDFIKGKSTSVKLPEKCDVLISETIGHYGIEEGIVEIFDDARKRLLKESPTLIPSQIELYLVPVSVPEFYDDFLGVFHRFREEYGINFDYIDDYARKFSYIILCPKNRLLSNPKMIKKFDLYRDSTSNFESSVDYKIKKKGQLTGFLGWFKVMMSDKVRLRTSPFDDPTHWQQCFFPVPKVDSEKGDEVSVHFVHNRENKYRFSVELM